MNDTPPEAARVQIELLRKAGPQRRAAIGSGLTNASKWRARRAIAIARPELSDREQQLFFIKLHYGNDLAQRVREALSRRKR
jgi:hypothetical protein